MVLIDSYSITQNFKGYFNHLFYFLIRLKGNDTLSSITING